MGSTKSYTIITNGIINKHIYDDDVLQDYLSNGWIIGKYRSKEQIEQWKTNFSKTYNNKSAEEKEELKLKNSISNKIRWENTSDDRRQEISEHISNGVSTMWNNLSDDDKKLREQHRLETRQNWTEEEYMQYCLKMSESAKIERANKSEEDWKQITNKIANTKKLNNSFNTSKPEEEMYLQLCEQYGEDNVKRNYNGDERYPWHCDFYISSEDLFIELNKFPTHYTEPFDETNPEHIKLLEHCKNEPNNWIEEQMVNIWAGTDVKKYTAAKKNNLNYIMVY